MRRIIRIRWISHFIRKEKKPREICFICIQNSLSEDSLCLLSASFMFLRLFFLKLRVSEKYIIIRMAKAMGIYPESTRFAQFSYRYMKTLWANNNRILCGILIWDRNKTLYKYKRIIVITWWWGTWVISRQKKFLMRIESPAHFYSNRIMTRWLKTELWFSKRMGKMY